MALKCICGVPGSGKTLEVTRLALRHYKKINSPMRKSLLHIGSILKIKKCVDEFKYYSNFPYGKINNIYTNYPILLDKKRKIYSHKVCLWDLDNSYSYLPDSIIIIDEVQLYVDSDEYKDKVQNYKIRKIAKFLQAHRHFGIKNIYFVSQHPSRIFKKARNICESYVKEKRLVKIPFTSFAFSRAIGYYEFDFYGRYIPRNREERKKLTFDYFKEFHVFNYKKIFKAYDSRYLSLYNYEKPIKTGVHVSSKVELNDLEVLFND